MYCAEERDTVNQHTVTFVGSIALQSLKIALETYCFPMLVYINANFTIDIEIEE